MIKYEVAGNFDNETCEKLKEKLQGKTYFNFDIQCGGVASNNSIIVTSNTKGYTNKDLKEMFTAMLIKSL